jgi:prepilin-type N-terminal cleavage/methylation domain-containing protein
MTGMRSDRGYSMIELLITVALITIVSAIAVPVFIESSARNAVWTASESIGAQIRQMRLKAISRNTTFQVRFDCPAAGQFRILVVDDTIDDDGRCDTTLEFDSGVFTLPPSVSFNSGGAAVPNLQVNGRGFFSSPGPIPLSITVTNGDRTRSLSISQTGQITFEDF